MHSKSVKGKRRPISRWSAGSASPEIASVLFNIENYSNANDIIHTIYKDTRRLMGAVCWNALLTLRQKGKILKSRWIATWSDALACNGDES